MDSQKWLSAGPLQHDDGQTMVDHDQFMVDHGQSLTDHFVWFDHGGPCFSNAVMVCSMVNHGITYMILTMVRTSLTIVIEIQEKLQYETWNLSLLDELNL